MRIMSNIKSERNTQIYKHFSRVRLGKTTYYAKPLMSKIFDHIEFHFLEILELSA